MKQKNEQYIKIGLIGVIVLAVAGLLYTSFRGEVVGQAVGESCGAEGKYYLFDSDGDDIYDTLEKCVGGKKQECTGASCPVIQCGNGVLEVPEVCDGGVGEQTCVSQGFAGGDISCRAAGARRQCTFDLSGCTVEAGKFVISLSEGQSFSRHSVLPVARSICSSQANGDHCTATLTGIPNGENTLRVAVDLSAFTIYALALTSGDQMVASTATCDTALPFCDLTFIKPAGDVKLDIIGIGQNYARQCGDGVKNQDAERCDGTDFGGQTCALQLPGTTGTLTCVPAGQTNECTFDTSGCSTAPPMPQVVVSVAPAGTTTYTRVGSCDFPLPDLGHPVHGLSFPGYPTCLLTLSPAQAGAGSTIKAELVNVVRINNDPYFAYVFVFQGSEMIGSNLMCSDRTTTCSLALSQSVDAANSMTVKVVALTGNPLWQ